MASGNDSQARREAFEAATHPYSPSTTPSVDGAGCLHREALVHGGYSLQPCRLTEREHRAATTHVAIVVTADVYVEALALLKRIAIGEHSVGTLHVEDLQTLRDLLDPLPEQDTFGVTPNVRHLKPAEANEAADGRPSAATILAVLDPIRLGYVAVEDGAGAVTFRYAPGTVEDGTEAGLADRVERSRRNAERAALR